MKKVLSIFILLFFTIHTSAQIGRNLLNFEENKNNILKDSNFTPVDNTQKNDSINFKHKLSYQKSDSIPSIDKYIIFDINDNKTFVDTTLSIKKHFEHNLFKKDISGFLPFANDGRGGIFLDYTQKKQNLLPIIGHQVRQIIFLKTEDINYYNVPTAWSRLQFQTAIQQGQQLDAFITLNLNEKLNVFTGYRGLRSLGAYINELASIGNFRIGGSYANKSNSYKLFTHIVMQDQFLQENGGITEHELYNNRETNREQLDVRLRDAETTLDNKRVFLSQQYALINKKNNQLIISQKMIYNYWKNLYSQKTIFSQNLNQSYFGDYFAGIHDKTRLKTFDNQIGISVNNSNLGQFTAFAHTFTYNYYFESITFNTNQNIIPAHLKNTILSLGGSYLLKTKPLNIDLFAQQSITFNKDNISNLKATTNIKIGSTLNVIASYDFTSTLPNFNARLHQSNFVKYNWYNVFNNEKTHKLSMDIFSIWANIKAEYQLINDKIFFSNDATNQPNQLITTPKQHSDLINYFSLSATKDWKWSKYGMENIVKFQQVAQGSQIINVPTLFTRNTFYYSNYFFNKALFLQTGITARFFTKYYADGYNPVLGEYYVQNQTKIGNYPIIDLFVNGKIKTANLFLGIENINSIIGKSNHYTAPNYPYKDFTIRFGIKWDFFN